MPKTQKIDLMVQAGVLTSEEAEQAKQKLAKQAAAGIDPTPVKKVRSRANAPRSIKSTE